VSDTLQGLWSQIRWNRPPKGFEKFFKDKPSGAPKQEPTPKQESAPKQSAPKETGGIGGGPKPASKAPPKGSQPDFSKFFQNAKSGGFGGSDGDKQRFATLAAFGTGALLLYLFANQMTYKEITWKDFVKTYLAKGHVVR
jgi:AFG3 family protein